MNRLPGWALASLVMLVAPDAEARDSVVVLRSDELPLYDAPIEAFAQNLSLPVEVIGLRGKRATAEHVAARLTEDPPLAVLALGAKAAWVAARRLPRTTPITWAMVREPERYALDELNTAGVRMELPPELVLAQFQLFAPEVRSLGILVHAGNTDPSIEAAVKAGEAAGYTVVLRKAQTPRDIRRMQSALVRDCDAIWLLPDPKVITPENVYALRTLTVRARVPILAHSAHLVEAGALLAVTPDSAAVGRLAAEQVQATLQPGATPATLAPLIPEQARVVLNRSTVERLGMDIDPALMDFVDVVVAEPSAR